MYLLCVWKHIAWLVADFTSDFMETDRTHVTGCGLRALVLEREVAGTCGMFHFILSEEGRLLVSGLDSLSLSAPVSCNLRTHHRGSVNSGIIACALSTRLDLQSVYSEPARNHMPRQPLVDATVPWAPANPPGCSRLPLSQNIHYCKISAPCSTMSSSSSRMSTGVKYGSW